VEGADVAATFDSTAFSCSATAKAQCSPCWGPSLGQNSVRSVESEVGEEAVACEPSKSCHGCLPKSTRPDTAVAKPGEAQVADEVPEEAAAGDEDAAREGALTCSWRDCRRMLALGWLVQPVAFQEIQNVRMNAAGAANGSLQDQSLPPRRSLQHSRPSVGPVETSCRRKSTCRMLTLSCQPPRLLLSPLILGSLERALHLF
jgi:hypothetical protein